MGRRQHVVVIGAGFGGLEAARRLAGEAAEVTVVDQRNHHTFQPLLYQVATAGLESDDICYSTRGIFQRRRHVRAVRATVTGADLEHRLVHFADGSTLTYDRLVLALGAVTADFGVTGVAEHAFGLKSAAEATAIRNHVLGQFERAARLSDPAERTAATSVVLVGGGPTGVEMAGGFAELFDRVLRRDFPEIPADLPSVTLIEGQDRVLGTFAAELSDNARRKLERMGVDVRLGEQVAAVEADCVVLGDGTELPTRTTVWAAGIRAHPLAEALGLATTRGGRVVVDDHLRVEGHDDVFAIGDLAASPGPAGSVAPQVAAAAIQGGRHVADVIAGKSPAPFEYRDKGSMATIGRNAAVVELPSGRRFTGFVGWATWLGLHLVMLVGFRNRANVLVNWGWNYLTYDRASRVVVEPDLELDG